MKIASNKWYHKQIKNQKAFVIFSTRSFASYYQNSNAISAVYRDWVNRSFFTVFLEIVAILLSGRDTPIIICSDP